MSTKPLRADARRNRDALIATAREVLGAGGAEPRFDDFAKLAGVGVGTLYRHFPTREALIEAVYREEVAALCARAAGPAGGLAGFLRAFVDYLDAHRGLARALATTMSARPDAMAEGNRALGEAIAALLAAVRPDVAPGAVMMVLHGICAGYDQPGWRADADAAVELVLAGLG